MCLPPESKDATDYDKFNLFGLSDFGDALFPFFKNFLMLKLCFCERKPKGEIIFEDILYLNWQYFINLSSKCTLFTIYFYLIGPS